MHQSSKHLNLANTAIKLKKNEKRRSKDSRRRFVSESSQDRSQKTKDTCSTSALQKVYTARQRDSKSNTHTHSDRQRQQQACESNRGSSKERRSGQRLCMGSNSSSSKERRENRTGERKSGEQGRGCAWAESQRVRCCQQQQQRQERQQQ